MGLFKPDLYRSFAVGFALGAAIVVWQVAPQMAGELIPQAHAATAPAPASVK